MCGDAMGNFNPIFQCLSPDEIETCIEFAKRRENALDVLGEDFVFVLISGGDIEQALAYAQKTNLHQLQRAAEGRDEDALLSDIAEALTCEYVDVRTRIHAFVATRQTPQRRIRWAVVVDEAVAQSTAASRCHF
jgi:hypothetical protein